MRISALTLICFGLLVAATLGSGGLALWHGAQSRVWDQRVALAQASYAEHLALQSGIHQALLRHGDARRPGGSDDGAMDQALRSRISASLDEIRRIIGQEIEMLGEPEIEELAQLSRIEADVQTLLRALADPGRTDDAPDAGPDRAARIGILDGQTHDLLARRITEALAGERAEVTETQARAEVFRDRIRAGVGSIMGAAVLVAVLAGWVYRRQVVRPTLDLVARIEAFRAGRGRISARIGGAWELRQLDQALDAMIAALDQRDLSSQEQTAQLEQAVQARTRELGRVLTQIEQSEAARRQMMADVSHELRTPLTIIQGEADVSLRGPVKTAEVYRDSLSRIRETARHANHVVDDLLLIARQESGKLRLDLRDVDLCAILRETAALMPRAVTLDTTLAQASTRADPMRIRQCLLALFQNATRYGGGTIWARVEPAANGFALIVEDNGAGMGDAEKAQAFDRFFRGSNAAQPEIDGTGLGLPIVRAIARAHGGSVTLEDRAGGGLRVVMVLAAERSIGLVWTNGDRDAARR